MISYKASVAQICVLLRSNDRQWSLTKPRSPKYVSYLDSMIINDLLQSLSRPKNISIWSLWSSMTSYKASVAQFFFYDRQWSVTKPRSSKYVIYLFSMIVNDLFKSLGRLYMFFLFGLYDRPISPGWKNSKFRRCMPFKIPAPILQISKSALAILFSTWRVCSEVILH